MEKSIATCRLILMCESTSKIIPPLLSRCLLIRCPAPSDNTVAEILQNVGQRAFGQRPSASDPNPQPSVPGELALRIAREAKGNLRRALLILDACRAVSSTGTAAIPTPVGKRPGTADRGGITILNPKMGLVVPDWELAVDEIAKMVMKDQSAHWFVECFLLYVLLLFHILFTLL